MGHMELIELFLKLNTWRALIHLQQHNRSWSKYVSTFGALSTQHSLALYPLKSIAFTSLLARWFVPVRRKAGCPPTFAQWISLDWRKSWCLFKWRSWDPLKIYRTWLVNTLTSLINSNLSTFLLNANNFLLLFLLLAPPNILMHPQYVSVKQFTAIVIKIFKWSSSFTIVLVLICFLLFSEFLSVVIEYEYEVFKISCVQFPVVQVDNCSVEKYLLLSYKICHFEVPVLFRLIFCIL